MLKKPWKLVGSREVLAAFKRYINGVSNFMAYAGTYTLDASTVTHHLDLALIPDWEGTDLVRSAKVEGDTLTLKTPEGDALIWTRVIST